MQKITPFLWFHGNAEEAANYYVSIFKNSQITSIERYGDAGPGPKGDVMVVAFQLEGQSFYALNGGSEFKFTPALSLMVDCKDQEEVDELWNRLSDGGETMACGWLTDKFGLTWQITPGVLLEMISDEDPVKSKRVMEAMMTMVKLDIAALKRAYDNE